MKKQVHTTLSEEAFEALRDLYGHEPSLSRMAGDLYSLDRLKEEAEKCELLCANCHRIVHSDRPPGHKGADEP